MAKANPFLSIHRHGLIRVGACTPPGTVGDPATNAAATIALAKDGHKRGADLLVFPELNISSYAIDDLHLQTALHHATEAALGEVAKATASLRPVLLVGAALPRNGRLYNCAVVIARGKILGVVPKTFLPNYREYYEKRWFASGADTGGAHITVAGQTCPFGDDLLFAATDLEHFVFHAEICEDYWAPTPPSTHGALAGALICCNLSASNITIGKARERALLCASQSARAVCGYVFAASGPGESTTDLAWDGQAMIHELGELLTESTRFGREPEIVLADLDAERIEQERMRVGTFNDAARRAGDPEKHFRRVSFDHKPDFADIGLIRETRRFPFVPNTPERLDQDCYEAFNIQVQGIAKRFEAAKAERLVIGISGGLDSTHALIVAAKALDLLGRPRKHILGYTMPGFATSDATRSNAWALMRAIGIDGDEIDIRPAATTMLEGIGHPFANGEPVFDITFENVQAGLRTDYLFRLANRHNGLVVGTGDLSELALGWCTYGVGDQMSHYAVNAGVPKTLIQFLIRWCIESDQFDAETDEILGRIVATEISPELVPAGADGAIQSTESKIGPYALNDFFLHHVVRYGMAPSKIAFLAHHAWRNAEAGRWPLGVPAGARVAYDLPTIKGWLEKFLVRFFVTSQFKRSAIPNGPKVSTRGALSPRGDWRAPSDGVATVWLEELAKNVP
ncbi:NAD(+) synthase [Sphingomonas immobilis]|uniref:Glutamine-dependent NAD(+) synthetase n=1 Tax=Sphingomonas immobilis TaxID=3063997 RepID=A0ABT9A0C8_9SPHN|nr:NAD(+) synthase [Sphingomonas sp. CA1-15]MDO7842912.1 NAD(+) synthase [Sphingomonas sp. CA1-15]